MGKNTFKKMPGKTGKEYKEYADTVNRLKMSREDKDILILVCRKTGYMVPIIKHNPDMPEWEHDVGLEQVAAFLYYMKQGGFEHQGIPRFESPKDLEMQFGLRGM